MTRTTSPRPVDIMQWFPELREHSATATRLHPRPGNPTITESSVGGPLLWSVDEPWPVCTDGDEHYVFQIRTPAMVRRCRQIYAAAQARASASGEPYSLTDAERAELPEYDYSEPDDLVNQPIPLVPVAQLWRRDVADYAGPEGTDLLQVLWCPLDHPAEGYNPRVRLFWRRSSEVTGPLSAAPEPPVVVDSYLPVPCVVYPEQVREFPYQGLLPEDLSARITEWETEAGAQPGRSYVLDLSLAPGWKVGGAANWSLTDPYPLNCAVCGAAMTLLFTADSGEWSREGVSWRPIEDPAMASANPTGVIIGRGYALQIFRCPASFDHPPATAMQ